MNRREFVPACIAAVAWATGARAQRLRLPVIGYLHSLSPDAIPGQLNAFRRGLAEMGFVEGNNFLIEYRSADGRYERLPGLAAELVRHPVDVIVCGGGIPSGLAAKAATRTIPIVALAGSDPVEVGLIESLGRPGGNVTGVAQLLTALDGKRLELLRELVPKAQKIGYLLNPTGPTAALLQANMEQVAASSGIMLTVLRATDERELEAAFAAIAGGTIDALIVAPDPYFFHRRELIVTLASREGLPSVAFFREFATVGGLMSYGTDVSKAYQQLGALAGRILKGAKPADLPMEQQSGQTELVINLRTAKALGLAVPQNLIVRADQVIE
jgi:putative tryptophan/tyrosine transport system substrate-binding protein